MLLSKSSRGHLRLALLRLRQHFAAIYPRLHANDAVRGMSFGETVIDIGAQRMQRQTSLEIPLGAGDFSAIQTAAHAHLDPLAAEAQRRVNRLAHGATESDALFELQGNR